MSEVRRAEIAEALFRCIAKQGYANTTVRDIAREANVRPGIIHHYFDSKEDILCNMTGGAYDRTRKANEAFERKIDRKPPREQIAMYTRFLITKIAGDKEITKVFQELYPIAHHNPKLNESLREFYGRYRKGTTEDISGVLERLDLDTADAKDLADLLICINEGATILYSVDPKRFSLSRIATLTIRVLDSFLGMED